MNPYETLGIEPTATTEEVQLAYRRAAMRAHPDREGGSNEQFQAVEAAGRILLDKAARAEYDASGRMPGDPPSIEERVESMLMDVAAKAADSNQPFVTAFRIAKGEFRNLVKQEKQKLTTAEELLGKAEVEQLRTELQSDPSPFVLKLHARYIGELKRKAEQCKSDIAYVEGAVKMLLDFGTAEPAKPDLEAAFRKFSQQRDSHFGSPF